MKNKYDSVLEQVYSKMVLKEEDTNHTLSSISNPLKQSLLDSLEKYLKSGEHQDGEDFYSNYKTASDLAEDFARHLKTSMAPKENKTIDNTVDEYGFTNKMDRDEQLRTKLG